MLAVISVVAFAQEKPQNTEKHACTETCDHVKAGAKSEMKACYSAAKGEEKNFFFQRVVIFPDQYLVLIFRKNGARYLILTNTKSLQEM